MNPSEPHLQDSPARLSVAIRVDAAANIGAGHLMRCLALAEALRAAEHRVMFLMRDDPDGFHDAVTRDHGFDVEVVEGPPHPPQDVDDELEDARHTIAALALRPFDWLIVDHYGLGALWESAVAAVGIRVLAIDDFATREHVSEILLDHNLVTPGLYGTHVGRGGRLLAGPKYALLRSDFSSAQPALAVSDALETIFVSFGGTDPMDQTTKVLHAIRGAHVEPRRVIVVTGHDHPNLAGLHQMAENWPELEVHRFVRDVGVLLRTADLAIGAGGVTALERLLAGVPSIVLTTASNQEGPASALGAEGAVLYLGPAKSVDAAMLTSTIDVMRNRHLRDAMRRRGSQLVDGHGPQRVVRAMMQRMPVVVRPAARNDSRLVFAWRNHPTVRETAFDPSEISWRSHETWFSSVLTDQDRHLLIAEFRDTPVGVVRFDIDRPSDKAEISIYLAPTILGKGIGDPVLRSALAWLASNEPAISRIQAEVRGANERSRRLFENVGFRIGRITLERDGSDDESADRTQRDLEEPNARVHHR